MAMLRAGLPLWPGREVPYSVLTQGTRRLAPALPSAKELLGHPWRPPSCRTLLCLTALCGSLCLPRTVKREHVSLLDLVGGLSPPKLCMA